MTHQTLTVGPARLTRVGYTELAIPPEFVGLTASQVESVPWREPHWADGTQVRVGAAAWFAEIEGTRLVFDPVQAADAVFRADRAAEEHHQAAIASTFAARGFARESIDLVVMSHIEGVGMVAWRNADGSWAPFFPNAQVLISDIALRTFLGRAAPTVEDPEYSAWRALIDQGGVGTYVDGECIAAGLHAAVRGGHCAGHATLHFAGSGTTPAGTTPAGAAPAGAALPGAEPTRAAPPGDTPTRASPPGNTPTRASPQGNRPAVTLLGHLAVSPLHLATGECSQLHDDPAVAWSLLHEAAADGATLVGPLWPAPGFGRWVDGTAVPGSATL